MRLQMSPEDRIAQLELAIIGMRRALHNVRRYAEELEEAFMDDDEVSDGDLVAYDLYGCLEGYGYNTESGKDNGPTEGS